jgi:hypothetical protein
MNRGRHEGETGICIYRFNSVYRTIEERAFIPFSLSDELLCSRIGNAASVSDGDELTLMIGTGLCRFDLKEKEVDTVVAGLGRENTVISGSGRMMAYSGDSGSGITLLDLSSMESVQTGAAGAVPLGFVREDLVYGVTGGSDGRIMRHHVGALETVEPTNQRTGGGGIVEIDHAHGHLLRQTLVEQRREEQQRQQRKHDHPEEVEGILSPNLQRALRNRPDVDQVPHQVVVT